MLVDDLVNYVWIMIVQYLSFAFVDLSFALLTFDIQCTRKGEDVCFSFSCQFSDNEFCKGG